MDVTIRSDDLLFITKYHSEPNEVKTKWLGGTAWLLTRRFWGPGPDNIQGRRIFGA
jgi:hypothetical protein